MNLDEQKVLLVDLIVQDGYHSRAKATQMVDFYYSYLVALKEGQARLGTGNGPSASYWFMMFFAVRPSIIIAAQRQGKSYLASWLIWRGLVFNPNWDFYTNLPIFSFDFPELVNLSPPNVYPVRSMSEMFRGIISSRTNGRKPVIILDEMGSEVTSYNWASPEAQSWRIFTQFQGHLGVLGPLLIYHNARWTPKYLRDGSLANQVLPIKIHEGKRYILSSATRPYKLVIDGPGIPYSSHGSYGFTIDVDMQLLMRMLWGVTSSQILDKLDKNLDYCIITNEKLQKKMEEIEKQKEEEELEDKISELRGQGKSIKGVAQSLGIPHAKAQRIIKRIENEEKEE